VLLHNHLRNALPTKRLAAHKLLMLQARKRIERRSQQQKHSHRNQPTRIYEKREPLREAHDKVYTSAHVVCCEAADEAVKAGRGRADAQEEWDFDEEDDEGGNSVVVKRSVTLK